ncbi:MAG: hypothetical protein IPN79_14125 [Saprospiraceae bacterium]|nr:hypothetical protein [Saprospiraceae bacterium]
MNVHLIKTPEYAMEKHLEVFNFLSSFHGPLQFTCSDYEFYEQDFPFLKKYRPDFVFKNVNEGKKNNFIPEAGFPLSWRELFSLCDDYRQKTNLPSEDFVVLLTGRRNGLNWFSNVTNKNIFVHTDDWDIITKSNPKYPIAYQVIENIIQSLMGLEYSEGDNEYIHMEPIGCMNDFCQNKIQILIKLRTADICPRCLDKIKQIGNITKS